MEVFILLHRILPKVGRGNLVETHPGRLVQSQAIAGLAQPTRVQTHFLKFVPHFLRTQLPGLTPSREQAIDLHGNFLDKDLGVILLAERERGTDYECFVTVRAIGDRC